MWWPSFGLLVIQCLKLAFLALSQTILAFNPVHKCLKLNKPLQFTLLRKAKPHPLSNVFVPDASPVLVDEEGDRKLA